LSKLVLKCQECGREITDPQRKNQKYCCERCGNNNWTRNNMREKNGTKPENYRGRYQK